MTLKTNLIAAGALIAASAATVVPAQASNFGFGFYVSPPNGYVHIHRNYRPNHRPPVRHALSAWQVRKVLQRQGYRYIRHIDRRGGVYIAIAQGYRGYTVRLTVNAYTGHVVHRQALYAPRRGWHH